MVDVTNKNAHAMLRQKHQTLKVGSRNHWRDVEILESIDKYGAYA